MYEVFPCDYFFKSFSRSRESEVRSSGVQEEEEIRIVFTNDLLPLAPCPLPLTYCLTDEHSLLSSSASRSWVAIIA